MRDFPCGIPIIIRLRKPTVKIKNGYSHFRKLSDAVNIMFFN